MRDPIKLTALLFIAVLSGLALLGIYNSAYDRAAQAMINQTIPAIELFQKQHGGAMPSSLADLPSKPKFQPFGIFSAPAILYSHDNTGYIICYGLFPFGSIYGYSSASHGWGYGK